MVGLMLIIMCFILILIVLFLVMYVAFRFVSQEEVVLKRCWLARYWGLCVQHGIVIFPFVQI